MTDATINNRFLPISYWQFSRLMAQFKKVAEESVGAECRLGISVNKDKTQYTTLWSDDIRRSLQEAEKPVPSSSVPVYPVYEDAKKLTRSLFRQAARIHISVLHDAKKISEQYDGWITFDRDENPKQVKFRLYHPCPK